jgi:hypothetical protein
MPITSEPRGPKPPLPGLVKCTFSHTVNPGFTTRSVNILHGRFTDNINHSLLDLASLASSLATTWHSRIMPSMSNVVTLVTVQCLSLGGDGLLGQNSPGSIGGGSASVLPPQCAVCVTWHAGITWRGGRPRTYLGGIPNGAAQLLGSPQISSTYSSALATGATNWLSDVSAPVYSGANWAAGVPSYYSKGAFRPVPLFFPFNGAVVHDRFDSQRRRSGKESAYSID